MLLIILIAVLHTAVGLGVARRQYARDKYEIGQMTKCERDCGSREWDSSEYKRKYCTCGYLKFSEWEYYVLAFMWIPFVLFTGIGAFVTGGEYEPKELKAERKEREKLERAAQFEKRIAALEQETGINRN